MNDDLHSQAEAYALGSLDSHETSEFETHLSHCDDCREEVAAMRDVTAQLSQAVATDPPASLRASILDAIAQTPQDAPLPATGAHAKEAPASSAKEAPMAAAKEAPAARGRHARPPALDADAPPSDVPDQSVPDNVVPIRRSWGSKAATLVAAASLVAAAAFGGWALNSRNDARDQADLAASRSAKLIQVLSSDDVQTASATSTTGGTATVVRSPSQGSAFLVASDLPDPGEGKVYEAWTIDGQTPVPAGTFDTDDQSGFELPEAALDTQTVAVTIEPEGGSEQPTSDIIMAFEWPDD